MMLLTVMVRTGSELGVAVREALLAWLSWHQTKSCAAGLPPPPPAPMEPLDQFGFVSFWRPSRQVMEQGRSTEARSGTERELWSCPKRSEGHPERSVTSPVLSYVTMHKLKTSLGFPCYSL